jgi:hypothetical protein
VSERSPLDAVLVEFVSEEGWPLAVVASRIRRMTGFVSSLSPGGYSVSVKQGASLFVDGEYNPNGGAMVALRGTYEENLAIWRRALESVAVVTVLPTETCSACLRMFRPDRTMTGKPLRCSECAK